MPNFVSFLHKSPTQFPLNRLLVCSLLTLGLLTSWKCAQASSPAPLAQATQPVPSASQNAPAPLKNLLTQIDTAASRGDVKGVIQFYSPNFIHGDGLTRQNMEKALTALWQRYPQLKYSTQIQSWKSEGNAIVAETVTKDRHRKTAGGRRSGQEDVADLPA